jgi:hypothetical protein
MINEILTAAAIPSRAARFPDPPEIHAVYFDSAEPREDLNPDTGPAIAIQHDCIVELYAPSTKAGDSALARVKAQLDSRGIRYTTQGWYWLDAIHRYQEIVEFSHIEKI